MDDRRRGWMIEEGIDERRRGWMKEEDES